jgi:hypothetical protein
MAVLAVCLKGRREDVDMEAIQRLMFSMRTWSLYKMSVSCSVSIRATKKPEKRLRKVTESLALERRG